MRHVRRGVLGVAVAAWALAGATPVLAGGGGGGGVCYPEPPRMDEGWVAIGDSCFSPRVMEVATGDAVRWVLEGQMPHTVTFEEGLDAGDVTPEGLAIQFNEPGTYAYSCKYHPGMIGTVRAEGAAVGGPPLEILGAPGVAPVGAEEPVSVLQDAAATRIEFSPLTAAVILLVSLPLSLAATLRIVGIAGPTRVRLRVPWESPRASKSGAAR